MLLVDQENTPFKGFAQSRCQGNCSIVIRYRRILGTLIGIGTRIQSFNCAGM